jgi:hypothetical protein
VPKDFKSLLPPKFIRLLEHKLETGAMTPDECKSVLKELMLREFERKKVQQSHNSRKAMASKIQKRAQTFLKKVLERAPAEPANTMEGLIGKVWGDNSTDTSQLPALSRHYFSARTVKNPKSLTQ